MKKIDLIKNMDVDQMANLFMRMNVAAAEAVLRKQWYNGKISEKAKEKMLEQIKQSLESEVV